MRSLLSQLLVVGPELAAFVLTSPILAARGANAVPSPIPAPSPNLDLSQLGRVAVAGDFDSISVYQYAGQSENFSTNNGSQALITQYPDGSFDALAYSDGSIQAMCEFKRNGKSQGVLIGGNFTSLGGVQAQSVALWDPGTNNVTPLPGLNGPVYALYCDNAAGTAYVGGMFTASHSLNAMAWTNQWADLPFAGFNGPVNSITKGSDGNIIFGGGFSGLGNTTTKVQPNGQVVNLAGGVITAQNTGNTAGFDDPKNIICKTGQDTAGDTWLLTDGQQGYWEGTYSYGFIPTMLRLYNTKYEGRGTKTFYVENLENGGTLALTYTDGKGKNQTCYQNCPLPEGNTDAQDFTFTQPVGFATFRIWLTDHYGAGAGLAGIEMFQDQIYSFAVNDFNEPKCDDVSNAAYSTISPATGLWYRVANNGTTSSDYLAAYLTDASEASDSTSVVFAPNIQASGNYSITIYTPGCVADDTCATRGSVDITGMMASGKPTATATITQTNNYDKYDQIYFGAVDMDSDTFAPTITLTPTSGQALPQTIVAQRVRFEIVTSSGGLNGLYEYDPNKATLDMHFKNSVVDSAAMKLDGGASVDSVIWNGNLAYVGGNFNGDGISNIFSVGSTANSKPQSLSNGGLNDKVQDMYLSGSMLYVGGRFSNTGGAAVQGLQNVAAYDTNSDKWIALGAGVNGVVSDVVPMKLNVTAGNAEECITVNGEFTSVNAFGRNKAFNAAGFAIWVPSMKNWLNNIADADIALSGKLMTSTKVPGLQFPLYAGQLSAKTKGFSGAVQLDNSGTPSLQSFDIKFTDKGVPAATNNQYSGVHAGIFYDDNGFNVTVLGGHFSATGSTGKTVKNLLIISGSSSSQTLHGVTELDDSAIVMAVAAQNDLVFAGGSITGKIDGNDIDGLVVYDLNKDKAASPQPPALTNSGNDVVVNAIAPQTDTDFVYVGGAFKAAGGLPCVTLCYYDAAVKQWNNPGIGLSGTIEAMFWSSKTELIIAGSLVVLGAKARMATYDSKKGTYTPFSRTESLPGEITSLTPADSSFNDFWAAGAKTSDGSAFLSLYHDDSWTSVNGLGEHTLIRSLQVLTLTSDHSSTNLVPSSEALMVMGNIDIPYYGNASAVLYNGTTFEPFLLTTKNAANQGSVGAIFVSNPQALLTMGGNHLAVGFVVLIGLAIALGIIFFIVVAGILLERRRRRKEGYVPMAAERSQGNLSRIPPEKLFGTMSEKGGPPKV